MIFAVAGQSESQFRSLPLIVSSGFCHRDVKATAKTPFDAVHNAAFIFQRLRSGDENFYFKSSNHFAVPNKVGRKNYFFTCDSLVDFRKIYFRIIGFNIEIISIDTQKIYIKKPHC